MNHLPIHIESKPKTAKPNVPFFGSAIQKKLSVGSANDTYEAEADAMADKVMRMQERQQQNVSHTGALVQRKCAHCEEEEKLRRKPLAESISPLIQKSPTKNSGELQAPNHIENQINSSRGSGNSMDNSTKNFMESRFDTDFSEVRIHTGSQAVQMSRELNAQAFTVGNDVYFNEGKYSPNSDLGRHLLAHELTHTIQQNKQNSIQFKLIQRVHGDRFGQATEDTTRNLVCDLTSPITVGSNPRYEVGQHGSEIGPQGAIIQYQWSVLTRGTTTELLTATTTSNTINIPATTAGLFTIRVQISSNRNIFSTLLLEQDVVAEDAFLTGELTTRSGAEVAAFRELVNDFRPYIINAATATGPNGITPALLASVLLVEVTNRPKAGRETENNDIGSYINTLERGSSLYPWQSLNHSMGVGQIRLSTAAMVLGNTPWLDQNRNNRSAARDTINSNFEGLSVTQKRNIYNLLRWPKSNIVMAANLLSQLKNRANRYPAENRLTFAANSRGVQIVATEYNQGASSSLEADASPSGYGLEVRFNMDSDPIIQNYFPNN